MTIVQKFANGQRVIVLDNGDPHDRYTGATGVITEHRSTAHGIVYIVWYDAPIKDFASGRFAENELAVAE